MKIEKVLIVALVAVALVACKNGESSKTLQLSPSSVTLHYEDTQSVKVVDETGTFTWLTGNDFIANVNEKGLVTGGHVGATVVTAQLGDKKGNCQITIEPKYYLFEEPYFGWGNTKAQIKNKLGTPGDEQETALSYIVDQNAGIIAMYMFKDNALYAISMLINVKNLSTLTYFLIERYQVYDEVDGSYYFINAMSFEKATLSMMLSYVKTNTIQAYMYMYMPYDESSSTPARKAAVEMPNSYIPSGLEYLLK